MKNRNKLKDQVDLLVKEPKSIHDRKVIMTLVHQIMEKHDLPKVTSIDKELVHSLLKSPK